MTHDKLLVRLYTLAQQQISNLRAEFIEESIIHNGLSIVADIDDESLFDSLPYSVWSDRMIAIYATVRAHRWYLQYIETKLDGFKPD